MVLELPSLEPLLLDNSCGVDPVSSPPELLNDWLLEEGEYALSVLLFPAGVVEANNESLGYWQDKRNGGKSVQGSGCDDWSKQKMTCSQKNAGNCQSICH